MTDVTTGDKLKRIRAHREIISSIDTMGGGAGIELVATGSDDGTVKVWEGGDEAQKHPVATLEIGCPVTGQKIFDRFYPFLVNLSALPPVTVSTIQFGSDSCLLLPMPSSIENIPNEILYHVLSYLPLDNLYYLSLAFTCKRFYSVTHPMLLSAYTKQLHEATKLKSLTIFKRAAATPNSDLHDGYSQPLSPEQYSELFASTSHMKELQVHYTISSAFIIAHLWSLCALLTRNVKLELITIQFTSEALQMIADQCPKPHRSWFRAFASLLRACVSHEGVQIKLTSPPASRDAKYLPFAHQVISPVPTSTPVRHDLPAPPIAPQPTSLFDRIVSFLKGKSRGRRKFSPAQRTEPRPANLVIEYSLPPTLTSKRADSAYPIPIVPLNTESRLSCLVLTGAVIFTPPIYLSLETYLLTPSQSSLTSLSISDSNCTHYDWHAILQLPAWQRFSRLEHLEVMGSWILFSDLLELLQRHPTIVDLDLSRYTAIGKVEFPEGDKRCELLPNLRKLNGTPELLIPFLDNPQSSKVRSPLLEALSITQAHSAIYAEDPLQDLTTVLKSLLETRCSRTTTTAAEGTLSNMNGKEVESAAATSGATTNPDSKIRHVSLRLFPVPFPELEDLLRDALTSTSQSDSVTRDPDSDAGDVFANSSAQSLCKAARALSHVGTSFELISRHRKVTIPVDAPW
ncbi:hypothetical protein EST38_g396 [Candolleomyces aberdarensis]|uniref:F-box domain-containing protein n=1 Tax=Candolleomyces aberdarensis TaxID=2316362 RepID=A0A4Q2E169_9AGAR|nr:hypothetical protein EST38_g396 [Candolleomyces aberdarensis]